MPFIRIQDSIVNFYLRRSQRTKRLHMKVTGKQAQVVAPKKISNHTILDFIHAHKHWLHKQIQRDLCDTAGVKVTWPAVFLPGAQLVLRDKVLVIHLKFSHRTQLRLVNQVLVVQLAHDTTRCSEIATVIKDRILEWYRQQAQQAVQHSLDRFCPVVGRWPSKVCLKQQKTRWGSCGINGSININWLLILAPEGVLEYVVVHELCHLFHRNHGPRFWQKVAACYPDFSRHRAWLARNGQSLMIS
jgi:predicted metal-dependent hydrolase